MLGSTPIMAFIATKDPARAKRFYEDTLKLRFVVDDTYALVFDANGTMLRVSKVEEFTPFPFTVLGWTVSDIAGAVSELTSRGVTFERYPWMPDGSDFFTFPGGSQVAWFKDPDGNLLSLAQIP
jgi:catechol 2,3-dioxygenase-like lactoylglutathione lyase family enzyme